MLASGQRRSLERGVEGRDPRRVGVYAIAQPSQQCHQLGALAFGVEAIEKGVDLGAVANERLGDALPARGGKASEASPAVALTALTGAQATVDKAIERSRQARWGTTRLRGKVRHAQRSPRRALQANQHLKGLATHADLVLDRGSEAASQPARRLEDETDEGDLVVRILGEQLAGPAVAGEHLIHARKYIELREFDCGHNRCVEYDCPDNR